MLVSRSRLVGAFLMAIVASLVMVPLSAQAETNDSGSALHTPSTFYVYAEAGESLELAFPRIGSNSEAASVTVVRPDGTTALECTSDATGDACAAGGHADIDQTGVWTVEYDIASGLANRRHGWTITVHDASGSPVPGRVWVERYDQYQNGSSDQTYWIVTREGYRYAFAVNGFDGIGSSFRANGFGLVEEGTCTPIYRSAEGTSINANGVPLENDISYSGSECGDAYKIFLDEPAADLPDTSTSARGTEWILNEVTPPAVDDLSFTQDTPGSRAGDINFELSGVNGGYAVQIDTNGDGDFDDPADRTIPWGSPPGAVSVPFDGLDGLGEPIGVCQDMNARVAVDRVGEVHFVLEDVERLAGGITLAGATPGVVAADPLLYWDDRGLDTDRPIVTPVLDGRDGADATVTGAHGWGQPGSGNAWGDIRAIENWSYYEASAGDSVPVAAPCSPDLNLTKNGVLDDTNNNGFADVGETINYTFTATNTGNTPLTGVSVDDSRITTGITPVAQDIPFGGVRTFAASYEVTQADLDAGTVLNVATATGEDPTGEEVGSNEARDEVPTPDRDPQLDLVKTGSLTTDTNGNDLADVGDEITYSFAVENTGNVTVTDVAIDDARLSGLSPATVTLAPGETQTFTAAPYAVTQADVNTGTVYNSATAEGESPTGTVTSPPSEFRIDTPDPDPGLTLDKTGALTGDVNSNGEPDVGDTITYTFEVENIGTVDLTGVAIDDPRIASVSPTAQDIPAGQTRTFTGTLEVAQSDVDTGVVRNTATAGGIYDGPDGEVPVESPPDSFELDTVDPVPGLEITKTGELDDTNDNGFADVGETIDYSFVVENTGNTTLVNVAVQDVRVDGLTAPTTTLTPGQQTTFTADPYVVTQADVDAGAVLNSATASGNVPGGPETSTPPSEFDIDGPPPAPELEIEKSASLQDDNGNGTADAGESIIYTFAVTNTGNVTMADVSINDPRIAGLISDTLDVLAPGATATFVADPYVVTAADVESGEIVNVATAQGTSPGGGAVESDSDEATTTVTPPPPGTPDAPKPTPSNFLPDTGSPVTWTILLAVLVFIATGGYLLRRRQTVEDSA